ncbi:thiamine-phosphate kinase [Qipengyuania sp. ASV99]|uniref:thiamine-phosphate kinase n=1 Tax=Qipengyuania sp. ASV99 TaxID=3399681 RepID=UPI003A4C5B84
MTEAEFLAALRTLPLHPGARDLRDDCAVTEIGGVSLILTHDVMSEGVHFRSDADLADVAWKLVAVNLSDLAAKGAEPIGLLLGHALSSGDARFIIGLREALSAFDVPLFGGDTVAASPGARTFGITAIGRATSRTVPCRSGARAGNAVYVTGTLGRAMLGFEGQADHAEAFNRPRPRLAEGRALASHVTAMMDVSDGLLLDAYRMAEASAVTLAIQSASVPVSDPLRLQECLRWGDDYELLFTLPNETISPVPATRIGSVEQRGTAPLTLDGQAIASTKGLGFQHA